MTTVQRLLSSALLLSCTLLMGCSSFSDRPARPRGAQGGFSVLADSPDHPAASRVIADIGAYAQKRGFVRQPPMPGPPMDPVTHESLPKSPERYLSGDIELAVSYQPATHRVSAYLHSSNRGRDRRFIDRFYHDFDREYGSSYGGNDPISETGYSDDSGVPPPLERAPGASVPGAPTGSVGGL